MHTMVVLCGCGLMVVLVVIWWYKKVNKGREFYEKFSGPPSPPFIGNVLELKDPTGTEYNMKYLKQVIKETLRLYPSVPYFGRISNGKLEFEGSIIPKGVTFLLMPFAAHRNPKFFPNPEEFNPSRFDTIDGKLPFTYTPFSAGSRNCIGQKFAMLELKSIISKILRNFQLVPALPVHTLRLSAQVILKSANGVKIGIRRRTSEHDHTSE